MNLIKQYFFTISWFGLFFLVVEKIYAADNQSLDSFQFRIAEKKDLDAILKTMGSIPKDSSDRQKLLVYPKKRQKAFVSDAIEKGRFFVAMDSNGACVGYKKFFKVETSQGRLKSLYKHERCVKDFVDCATVNFSNGTVQLSDRITQLDISGLPSNLLLFHVGSSYVVQELRGLRINSRLSTKSFDDVFLLHSNVFAEKSQVGFAYCLSKALDYDDKGNGKSRTPLIVELFLKSLAYHFAIGSMKLYRFVELMPSFDRDGNVVQDSSSSVQGYGNLCIIDRREE